MELNSSVAAVVTGGASGLGEATVRALAAKGVKVAIFDMNAEKGEAVAKEVGGVFCKCNVTSDEEVDAAFAKARAAHGQERRSEEHTSELQSQSNLVCRLLLEKKKQHNNE